MICRNCSCMHMGYIKERPEEAYCLGVKHPFKIENLDGECTEYFDNDYDTIPNWANLDLKSDTYSAPRLIILVGLPGSGKSTFARRMVNTIPNIEWISSDQIRKELYGDEACQANPERVFELMQQRTVDLLNEGYSVIYDATSVTRKSRAGILDKCPKHVQKQCVIVWAPIDICIERDKLRDRSVGEKVIDKMLRRFEAPFYDEGFTRIEVELSDVFYNRRQYYVDLISALDIPHDNPHHSASVMEHCYLCGQGLLGETGEATVTKAGYLHDIGKPYTKTFTNRKGEETDIAHYYDHQAVGAYLSYGITGHNITLAWLISTHMAPFINQKYYNSLPTCYKSWIDALHKADKAAH